MKQLTRNEYIAVSISLVVVGFFFIFGIGLIRQVFAPKEVADTSSVQNISGITIKDLVIGNGDEALPGKNVTIHYIGYFRDGTIFDSSIAQDSPVSFRLGAGQVITGWERGIIGMKVGGVRILTIPPELAYGPDDYQGIPGGSTLVYEIRLLDASDDGAFSLERQP